MSVVEAQGVVKRYGTTPALAGVDLVLDEREILALLGPNGAGKSTLVSVLSGLRRVDEGRVVLCGGDPRAPGARARLGVALQEAAFPTTLRVREIYDLVAGHFSRPAPRGDVLERFELASLADRQTGGLSGGQRRRLALALAFAGSPRVVFLDEPGGDLDVPARHALWRTLRAFVEDGGSVLLTTHHLDEAEALADRVAVIRRGLIVADDSLAAVRGRLGSTRVRLRVGTVPPLAAARGIEHHPDGVVVRTDDVPQLFAELTARGVPVDGAEIVPVTLEDAFLDLLGADEP